jgi:type II secretory pathway pseudopilin PulG
MRPHSGSRSMLQPRRGHTLWEMLLVLALLGTVTAIVAPSLGLRAPLREQGVTAATKELMAVLAEARLTALERGTSIDVVIDPATARVWTFSVDRGERRLIATGMLRLAPGAMLEGEAPRVRVTFDAAGTASGGPVIVRGIEGARQVGVDPWSGVADAAAR